MNIDKLTDDQIKTIEAQVFDSGKLIFHLINI